MNWARSSGGRRTALLLVAFATAACSSSGQRASQPTAVPPTEAVTADQPDTEPAPVATEPVPVATEPAPTEPPTVPVPVPEYVSGTSDFLFDQSALRTFELDIDPAKLAILDEAPADEDYVEGSLTFNGETIGPIGVRYKGSIGAFSSCTDGGFNGGNPFDPSGKKVCTKLSIKLKMNWNEDSEDFYGVRRVQLHSQNLDDTMMHERLGYWIFREMGVPVSRSTHARVVINGEFVGLFALTEQIDARFAEEYFSDGSGNLYQEAWPFDDSGQPQTSKWFLDNLETNTKGDASADLTLAFAKELVAAKTTEAAIEVLRQRADVDVLLRTLVVDRAIKNDDGALHWYCFDGKICAPHNFFWYENPTAKTVHWIPWDLDNAMDEYSGGPVGFVTKIADRLGDTRNDCQKFPFGVFSLPQRSAGCDPMIAALSTMDADFDRIRAELLAGPMSVESINARLDEWSAQIEPSVAEAAELHDDAVPVDKWKAAVERLRARLIASRATDGR